jgi:hypothetical protein
VKFPRTRYTLIWECTVLLIRHRTRQTATLVFFIAMTTRLFGIVLTTVTDLNTYARADVKDTLGCRVHYGWYLPGSIYYKSRLFKHYQYVGECARSVLALTRSEPLSIYVLESLSSVHSPCRTSLSLPARKAALVAVVPLNFYPSFVFIHSTVLREAALLVRLTTGRRYLTVPSPRLSLPTNYGIAVLLLWFSVVFVRRIYL